uniref:Putative portal protein n=1 Tax=viral metagenome TaxID=1070528 RepID=A0A6H1Z835_9ZZZZ
MADLVESAETLQNRVSFLEANFQERIAELELQLEERGWERITGDINFQFSRHALTLIVRQARLYFLKNPLIRRAVLTIANYVFGQGLTVAGGHPLVDEVVQEFWADEKNRVELTSAAAMHAREVDLFVESNLFWAFFVNSDGDTRIRTIPFDEIVDVICNPEDAKEPWYYQRNRPTATPDGMPGMSETVLHPDWQYTPKDRPESYHGHSIEWDVPVYHVKSNALNSMKFGVPELYAAHDWAKAYNAFLSDWATIVRSLSRFAWNLSTKGGAGTRGAIKAALDSQLSTGDSYKPAPAAGSVFIDSADSTSLTPIPKTGATVSAEDGRRLLLMVCAATGLPETFFGDVSVGTLATAKSLDRPTELLCLDRQRLWQEIIESICSFVVEAKARAGTLRGLTGQEIEDDWDEMQWVYGLDPEDPSQPLDPYVRVEFPSLVEHDVGASVGALVDAATLRGQMMAGTLDREYLTRKLLVALGETSVEEVMAELFPEGEEESPEAVAEVRAIAESLRAKMAEFVALQTEVSGADGSA